MSAKTVEEVRSHIADAEQAILSVLDEMTHAIGDGWLLDVDVGAITVGTVSAPNRWVWRANITARLQGESK